MLRRPKYSTIEVVGPKEEETHTNVYVKNTGLKFSRGSE
jgi:hypothetical protein